MCLRSPSCRESCPCEPTNREGGIRFPGKRVPGAQGEACSPVNRDLRNFYLWIWVCLDRREIVLDRRKRLREPKNDCGMWVRGRDPKAVASCLERIQELRSARC